VVVRFLIFGLAVSALSYCLQPLNTTSQAVFLLPFGAGFAIINSTNEERFIKGGLI